MAGPLVPSFCDVALRPLFYYCNCRQMNFHHGKYNNESVMAGRGDEFLMFENYYSPSMVKIGCCTLTFIHPSLV